MIKEDFHTLPPIFLKLYRENNNSTTGADHEDAFHYVRSGLLTEELAYVCNDDPFSAKPSLGGYVFGRLKVHAVPVESPQLLQLNRQK